MFFKRKKLLYLQILFLFILVRFSVGVYAITFTGGYIETLFLSHYGNTTNVLPEENNLYQEIRINIIGHPNRNLEIRSVFKTYWLPLNKFYNFDIMNWVILVKYIPYYFLTFGVGDIKVDYSPYTIHTEEWQDNIFRGLMLEIELKDLYIHSFVGFHTESTNPVVFQGQYYKSNLGFIVERYYNNVSKEYPTIWGGFFFKYKWNNESDVRLIYAHENYMIDKSGYGYYFFYNNIYQAEINFSATDFLLLNSMYAVYAQNYRAYCGAWDYYGPGKHRLILDYSQLRFFPAYKFGGFIKIPFGLKIGIYYRYIDKEYTPVHMDNDVWNFWSNEHRGQNFLDNVYSDTKGMIYSFIYPVYKKVEIGAEHRDFENIDETVDDKDTRIFVRFNSLFEMANIQLLYRIHKGSAKYIDYPIMDLKGFYINAEIKFNEQWSTAFIYRENMYFRKGYNELILKLKFNF